MLKSSDKKLRDHNSVRKIQKISSTVYSDQMYNLFLPTLLAIYNKEENDYKQEEKMSIPCYIILKSQYKTMHFQQMWQNTTNLLRPA